MTEHGGVDSQIDALERAAAAAYEDGQLSMAADLLEQASIMPGCPPSVWQNLGLVRMDMEDFEGAIAAYSHSVKWIPVGLVNRGLAFDRLGNADRARADYEAALEIFPEDVDALANLGTLELSEGNTEAAHTILSRAVALDPQINWQLSDVFVAEGNREQAREALKLAVAAGEQRALLDIASLAHDAGDDAEAIEALRAAIERGVDGAEEQLAEYAGTGEV